MINYSNANESTPVLDKPALGDELRSNEMKGEVNTGASIFDPSIEIKKLIEEFAKTGDSKEKKLKKKKKSKGQPNITILPASVEVVLFDEPFLLFKNENEIHLKHRLWSLAGFGETVTEAIESIRDNGKILLTAYDEIDKEDLSEEAKEMLTFLRITFGNE